MKNRFAIIIFAAALAASCSIDNPAGNDFEEGLVTVNIKTLNSNVVTKADTKDGEGIFAENLISDIHYYIYTDETASSVIDGVKTVDINGSENVVLPITAPQLNTIFPSDATEATLYIVANAGSLLSTGSKTIAQIEATEFEIEAGEQESFIMSGKATLTRTITNNMDGGKAELGLARRISKITLHLEIANSFTKEGEEISWYSEPTSLSANFRNLAMEGTIKGEKADSELDDSEMEATDFSFTPGTDKTSCTLTVPVYSCARTWNSSDADTRPCIDIVLPWNNGEGTETKAAYYKIILNGLSLDPNMWYDYTVTLDGLGSFTPEEAVTIEDLTFSVGQWNTAVEGVTGDQPENHNTEAEIEEVRILAVERTEYTMYNTTKLVIPFISTHNCKVICEPDTKNKSGVFNEETCTIDNEKHTITLEHTLVNDFSSKPYDYVPYTFKITVYHTDKPAIKQVITVTQNPSVVLSFVQNVPNSTVFVDGLQSKGTTSEATTSPLPSGFGFESDTFYRYFKSSNVGSYTKNSYTVSVSNLDGAKMVIDGQEFDYEIGDPRVRYNCMEGDTMDPIVPFTDPYFPYSEKIANTTVPHINGSTSHNLTYYYKTNPELINVIAPEFRTATGWCSGGMDVEQNTLKCATYQEAGYPAGRWRMPTEAEIVFMLKLQSDKYIDKLYTTGTGNQAGKYMGANGKIYRTYEDGTISIDTGTGNTASFRCVYDSWYWDNTEYPRLEESKMNTFTWGDQEIY